ncbi:hypothetical protein [Undibacterium sp. Xuan67W]|uniref:hypothetical protein n=1 Tax=Undibacterium sp. Xuan67W TaxID=3413057 RepID=UPI003BF1CE72
MREGTCDGTVLFFTRLELKLGLVLELESRLGLALRLGVRSVEGLEELGEPVGNEGLNGLNALNGLGKKTGLDVVDMDDWERGGGDMNWLIVLGKLGGDDELDELIGLGKVVGGTGECGRKNAGESNSGVDENDDLGELD